MHVLFQRQERAFSHLTAEQRYGVIHRNAMCIFGQLAAVCKPSVEFADRLDRLQRWVFCRTHNFFPVRNEPLHEFQARRQRASRRFCQEHGLWSDIVFAFFLRWHKHTERRGSYSNPPWFLALLKWHGPEWLTAQRSQTSSGRPSTRVLNGRPHARHAEVVTRATERSSRSSR